MLKKAVVVSLVVCLAFVSLACSKKLSKDEMIERGKYLVNACGVLAHHTPLAKDGKPDLTRFMAGNATGYKGAWGTYYPKNLTPENATGIGMMNDEEVINIIKEEGSNGKAPLYFDYYRGMTDEDLKCIVEYLRTLTPLNNQIPADLKAGESVKAPEKKAPAPVKKTAAPVKKTSTPAKKTAPKKK